MVDTRAAIPGNVLLWMHPDLGVAKGGRRPPPRRPRNIDTDDLIAGADPIYSTEFRFA